MALPSPARAAVEDHQRTVDQAADLGLFSPGGFVERYPGAVVLAARDGIVLGANESGEPIASALRTDKCPELRDAINAAVAGRTGQVNPLLLGPDGEGQETGAAYDIVVVPWGDGSAALLLARDITLERSLRNALIESRQRYKDLVDACGDFAWETDSDGKFTFLSSGGALDFSPNDLLGTTAFDLQIDRVDGVDSPFLAREPVREIEVWAHNAQGTSVCLLVSALPLFGPDGAWRGARGLCRDVTKERSQEARLAGDRQRERLLGYILRIVRDEMDPAQMLGAAAGALVPALPATGVSVYRQDDSDALTCVAQAGRAPAGDLADALVQRVAKAGETAEAADGGGILLAHATRLGDTINGVLCVWREGTPEAWTEDDRFLLAQVACQMGTAQRQLSRQRELEELSSTDPLTGLLNRRSFIDELERRLTRRAGWRGGAALFFVDLDNFKAVNDLHGHQRGDEVLTMVADLLRGQTRSSDLLARLGGDEFALFAADITRQSALEKGRELVKAAGQLADLSADPEYPLGLSIGVAFGVPDRQENADEMIDRADQAMYQVKRGGKGGIVLVGQDDGSAS